MAAPAWVSSRGVAIGDLVPHALRRRWVSDGHCPDRDVHSLFSARAAAHPRRQAVVDAAGTVDYARLDRLVRQLAIALVAHGCGPRDVIAIQVPNDRRAVAAELAVTAIGAVSLPLACGRGTRDALSLLRRSRASAVVVAAQAGDVPLAANLAALRARLPDLAAILVFGAAPPGCASLDGWLATGNGVRDWRRPPIDADAPARIMVSSGTEGAPKMVAYSHNAIAGGRANYVAALHHGARPMRSLVLVPLSTAFGSLGTLVTIARLGGTLILLDRFDAAAALRAIDAARPTHVFGVPTMLRRMASMRSAAGAGESSLRAVVASGAPLDASTHALCGQRFGCQVINVYGTSDGVNCHTARWSGRFEAGCAGRPDPRVAEIQVVGDDGRPLGVGEPGEIWARGPMTPLSYVADPELDARRRAAGGWVRSGDRGVLADDGSLRVLGRSSQLIVRGGYNISPTEVEGLIAAHPGVAEVACVAIDGGDLGERVCACVAPRPDAAALTLALLNAYLEDVHGLERRKLPEALLTLPLLPLNDAGKVCRATLVELAQVERERARARTA